MNEPSIPRSLEGGEPPRFCPGYVTEPFRSLCAAYPAGEVYPSQTFYVEWGPVFHRGRLDGSAKVLVLALAPARMELIARRVMLGPDGPRIQGLFRKLGITRSYVIINSYLYAIARAKRLPRDGDDEGIVRYRHAWLDALVTDRVGLVLTLGARAQAAWELWKGTSRGAAANPLHVNLTHPTQPESAARGDSARYTIAMSKLLGQWNDVLPAMRAAITEPDVEQDATPYRQVFTPSDLLAVPHDDLPAGTPDWMRYGRNFAHRVGMDRNERRRQITISIPDDLALPGLDEG